MVIAWYLQFSRKNVNIFLGEIGPFKTKFSAFFHILAQLLSKMHPLSYQILYISRIWGSTSTVSCHSRREDIKRIITTMVLTSLHQIAFNFKRRKLILIQENRFFFYILRRDRNLWQCQEDLGHPSSGLTRILCWTSIPVFLIL